MRLRGNKWKQFPINEIKKQSFTVSQKVVSKLKILNKKPKKTKKKVQLKSQEKLVCTLQNT